MTYKQKTNPLAHELLTIVKDLISENDLVNGVFITEVRLNGAEDTIILKDIANKETYYSLSETSYIFTDNLDMLGSFNQCAYKTVLKSTDREDYLEKRNSFMKSFLRIKEIESLV